jgi:beta-lactam-binding protein with PASTA domain
MAKHNLRKFGCNVGKVRYAYGYGPRTPAGVVISQNPEPHWQLPHGAVGTVNLVISKLKPRS